MHQRDFVMVNVQTSYVKCGLFMVKRLHTYDITAQQELHHPDTTRRENLVSGNKLMSGPWNLIIHTSCSSALSQSRRKYHNLKTQRFVRDGPAPLGRDERDGGRKQAGAER